LEVLEGLDALGAAAAQGWELRPALCAVDDYVLVYPGTLSQDRDVLGEFRVLLQLLELLLAQVSEVELVQFEATVRLLVGDRSGATRAELVILRVGLLAPELLRKGFKDFSVHLLVATVRLHDGVPLRVLRLSFLLLVLFRRLVLCRVLSVSEGNEGQGLAVDREQVLVLSDRSDLHLGVL